MIFDTKSYFKNIRYNTRHVDEDLFTNVITFLGLVSLPVTVLTLLGYGHLMNTFKGTFVWIASFVFFLLPYLAEIGYNQKEFPLFNKSISIIVVGFLTLTVRSFILFSKEQTTENIYNTVIMTSILTIVLAFIEFLQESFMVHYYFMISRMERLNFKNYKSAFTVYNLTQNNIESSLLFQSAVQAFNENYQSKLKLSPKKLRLLQEKIATDERYTSMFMVLNTLDFSDCSDKYINFDDLKKDLSNMFTNYVFLVIENDYFKKEQDYKELDKQFIKDYLSLKYKYGK